MSAISEEVRAALYGKLNVAAVTDMATRGVHFMIAPSNQTTKVEPPYVIFSRVPVEVHYALANNLTGERDLWLIKAVTDEDSSTSTSAPQLAEDILTACETAIGTSLDLDSYTTSRVRRVNEIPNYMEKVSDRMVFHHGFHLEVFAS